MLVKCTENEKNILMDFLTQEPINNTFFISDIDHYGFDKSFQQAYIYLDDKSKCQFAYLVFHNVMILAGHIDYLETSILTTLLTSKIDIIMGKDSLFLDLKDILSDGFMYSKQMVYKLINDPSVSAENLSAVTAGLEDVSYIYDFLNTIPEFKGMYASQSMISNRISGTEGTHIYYKKDGNIIAHGNTAANTISSCFIGGVATHKAYRHRGYAKRIVAQLSKEALSMGRYPCIMNTPQYSTSLFEELGFIEHGHWGTLRRK